MEGLIVSNVLLWVLLVAVAFVVMGLVRQIGVLHGRLAPAGALMVDKGVAVNEAAPQITAADRKGRPVNFGYAGEKSQLLFFLSPTCPICKSCCRRSSPSPRNRLIASTWCSSAMATWTPNKR